MVDFAFVFNQCDLFSIDYLVIAINLVFWIVEISTKNTANFESFLSSTVWRRVNKKKDFGVFGAQTHDRSILWRFSIDGLSGIA